MAGVKPRRGPARFFGRTDRKPVYIAAVFLGAILLYGLGVSTGPFWVGSSGVAGPRTHADGSHVVRAPAPVRE